MRGHCENGDVAMTGFEAGGNADTRSPSGGQPPVVKPVVKLKGQVPVGSGSLQRVYQHPGDPDCLIKIMQLDKARERARRKFGNLRIQRTFGFYNAWVRELNSYIAMRSRSPDGECPEFMQRYYGVVETDLGLGLLVGKVTDRDGNLAPPLRSVVERYGFTDDLRRKLADLQARIEALNLVTTDISPGNILLGWSRSHGDHLVVIEGFGANTLIPVKSMVPFLNRRSIRRHFARIIRRLERADSLRKLD